MFLFFDPNTFKTEKKLDLSNAKNKTVKWDCKGKPLIYFKTNPIFGFISELRNHAVRFTGAVTGLFVCFKSFCIH